jgi:SAM-dependent methyltransferase
MGNVLNRAIAEVGHWLRPNWSFASVGKHWDDTEDYDHVNEETYSYFRRFTDGFQIGARYMSDGALALDFCARTGNGTLYFYERGKVNSAACVDVSKAQGKVCRERLRSAGFEHFIWTEVGDYRFPFASGIFDTVLCFETVEHFSRPEILLTELGRVTKTGGTMILTTPNVLWEPVHAFAAIVGLHHSEGPHRFIRYPRLLQAVGSAGFRVEASKTTVLVPAGPASLIKLGEWLEGRMAGWLMSWMGLRRILVCRKVA